MPNRKFQSRRTLCAACLLIISALSACEDGAARAQEISSSPAPISTATPAPADSTAPSSRQRQSWYEDFNALTAIASVGALVISVIALFLSHRSSTEQRKRERREELRNIIEKLISFREDLDSRINKLADANERINLDRYLNTKRRIYLQAAEKIALELSAEVSSTEYRVLAAENFFDSDFSQMRLFNEKAVKAAQNLGGDKVGKADALRNLGWGYYLEEPYRDIAKGRHYYQSAVEAVGKENDPYSIYLAVSIYREWALREIWVKEREYAVGRLDKASEFLRKLPDWFNLKYDELRAIAAAWSDLGASYFQDERLGPESKLEKARAAVQSGLNLLRVINDDNTKDLRGRIYQEWSKNEILWGSRELGDKILEQAEQCYLSLSEGHPIRLVRLNAIKDFLYYINAKISESRSREQPHIQESIPTPGVEAAAVESIPRREDAEVPAVRSLTRLPDVEIERADRTPGRHDALTDPLPNED